MNRLIKYFKMLNLRMKYRRKNHKTFGCRARECLTCPYMDSYCIEDLKGELKK